MKVMVLNPPSKYSKNVVRDLLYGCWCKGKRIARTQFPPLNLIYIATVLEHSGHEIIFIDAQGEGITVNEVKKICRQKNPDIIISSTSTMSFKEDAKTLKELKDESGAKTLVFGSHPTFMPYSTLEQEGIDFIAQREPEYIIRDFINSLENSGVETAKKTLGIGYKRENGEIVINPPYPWIENLDELPYPNRQYISNLAYFNPLIKKLPWTTALTSRGCPGTCNFCTSPKFYGNKYRMRSPENVIGEVESIIDEGYREIFFRDETFTASKERVKKICELMIEKGLEISWICNARVGTVTKELLYLMKKAGCHYIKFGVESGSQIILKRIKKGITVDMIRRTFQIAREVGIDTHAHFMLGCPGETEDTIEKTIKFAKEIKPTTVTFGIYTPYPGTEIFEFVKERYPEIGDGSSCDLSRLHTSGYYNHVFCDIGSEALEKAVRRAYRSFYLRPSYLIWRFFRIRSIDEFRRVLQAGFSVFSFSVGGDDV